LEEKYMTQDCIKTPYALNRPGGYGKVVINGVGHNHSRVVYATRHKLEMKELQGKVVRHTCNNCWCINPEHLVLGTWQDNMDDKMQAGRWTGGQPRKLDSAVVAEIRLATRETAGELAARYGVSRQTICNVLNHKSCYKD
jgi:hypothetical protein